MMMTYQASTISLIVALSGMVGTLQADSALAQTRLAPRPTQWDQPSNVVLDLPTDPSIYFMMAGPHAETAHAGLDPTRWRLALSCAEIYCDIDFDYIEEQEEYEGFPRIVTTYHLPGSDIAPIIAPNRQFLHNLHFVAWESWNQVMLREGDRYFRIQINPDQSFTITTVP